MRLGWVILRISFPVIIAIFGVNTMGHAKPAPIAIGFVGDFSDVSRAYTRNAFVAAKMAVDQFNADGGLLGRPVVLHKRDGGNDPQRHEDHVRALAAKEKVVAIFGGASSSCVFKASEACRVLEIPYLVSIGNSQSVVVEHGHPFVFLFAPNTWMESKGFSFFATLMPWQRFAWLGPDYVWGHEVLRYFKQNFDELGAAIDWAVEAWHPLGTRDFAGIVQQIIDAKPDALVVASWGEDVRHFIMQAKPTGLFGQMAVFGGFSLIEGKDGRLIPEGIWTLSRGPFNFLKDKFPMTKAFTEKFHRISGAYPLGFTLCCYDSLLAWRQAVENASSAEPAVVAEALKGMSFSGLRGDRFIRAVDGQLDCPAFFGRLVYRPQYPFAIMELVIEIPAAKTWLPESEVLSRRKGNGP
ncbi:MAG: ABC transporter substrate-binding protein [Desulfobacterales bacterium]|nr:ABC transporter substrate-binding protein [Desulfobacterales bacterium]